MYGGLIYQEFPLATLQNLQLSGVVHLGGWGLKNFSTSGRHRPQRCRQTDQTAGGAVAYVQATSRGWLKAIVVV